MRNYFIILIMSLLYLCPEISNAEEQATLLGLGQDHALSRIAKRFKPHDPTYMIWPQFSENDDVSLEVQYSLKYIFYDGDIVDRDYVSTFCAQCSSIKRTSFFSYTGKFDFYLFTRASGPVINRTSNPALHYKIDIFEKTPDPQKGIVSYSPVRWFDVAYQHRSDGQVVSAKERDDNDNYIAESEYREGNYDYFDSISRGADYFSISAGSTFGTDGLIDIMYKAYFSSDDDVTWGRYADENVGFDDFDLVRVRLSQTFFKTNWPLLPETTLGVDYTVGKKGFATDSVDLFTVFPLKSINNHWSLPVMIKTHFGPMDRLSDYTRSVWSVGVGFAFSYLGETSGPQTEVIEKTAVSQYRQVIPLGPSTSLQ